MFARAFCQFLGISGIKISCVRLVPEPSQPVQRDNNITFSTTVYGCQLSPLESWPFVLRQNLVSALFHGFCSVLWSTPPSRLCILAFPLLIQQSESFHTTFTLWKLLYRVCQDGQLYSIIYLIFIQLHCFLTWSIIPAFLPCFLPFTVSTCQTQKSNFPEIASGRARLPRLCHLLNLAPSL